MKRYEVEVLIDGPAEEAALARLVAKLNETSPTPLSVEEALASVLYDIVLSSIPRCSAGFVIEDAPLAVDALLDEAHAVPRALPIEELLEEADVVFDELLQAMELTREVTQ